MGYLALARDEAFTARTHFESALTYFPNHPSAIVGLSTILLDMYAEKLLPPPPIPQLDTSGPVPAFTLDPTPPAPQPLELLPCTPLGLFPPSTKDSKKLSGDDGESESSSDESEPERGLDLAPPHKATSLPLVDRLAARDRAYGLLRGLTGLGSGWDNPEAWFAMARAHEEGGEAERAKEALWWCVELEEGRGVRGWGECGGYIIV